MSDHMNLTIIVKLDNNKLDIQTRCEATPDSEIGQSAAALVKRLTMLLRDGFESSVNTYTRLGQTGDIHAMSMGVAVWSAGDYAKGLIGWELYDQEYDRNRSVASLYLSHPTLTHLVEEEQEHA